MRLLLSLSILLSLVSQPSRAQCDCLWQGSFSDVQAATDLVVSGTVTTSKGNSIDSDSESAATREYTRRNTPRLA